MERPGGWHTAAVADDFVIARNPDGESQLPYLLRLPLSPHGMVVKARATWPRTAAVYCHAADGWPEDAEILERVPVRWCGRRGAAIDLVLDRGRENRSQFVFTIARGREMIFWQTARVARKARPSVAIPTARAAGLASLTIVIDDQEKYPYRFSRQQVEVSRRRLPAGDYALELEGRVVASVERKSLEDLVASLLSGRLGFVMSELGALPRAAVVVEERYSRLFSLDHVRGSVVADALAEAQVRWPSVPIAFCETRPLAEDWTYRFLAAARVELSLGEGTDRRLAGLASAGPLEPPPPTVSAVRAWALKRGLGISDRGRLPADVVRAYEVAHKVRLGASRRRTR